MRRLQFLLQCGIILAALTPAALLAQPMGPMQLDPSRMSGIPRPDPQVPKQTLTVRLIRNQLANKIVDHPVELVDGSGKLVASQKTDGEGRATFTNLGKGPFNARAKDESGQEIVSQAIDMPDDVGVRVMLVFRAAEVGAADGTARIDKSLEPGSVKVDVKDESGGPAPDGVEVLLIRAESGGGAVNQDTQPTQAGSVLFTKQKTGATYGYVVQVVGKNGSKQTSPPFRLVDNVGMHAVFKLRNVSNDLSQLRFERGTHLLVELNDQALAAIWVIQLENGGTTAVDPGPGGLRIELPPSAVSISLGEDAVPGQVVDGKAVVVKGPIAVGRTEIRIFFGLPYSTEEAVLDLSLPLPLVERAAILEEVDGMKVNAPGMASERRELGGKPLLLLRGAGGAAGERLKITLSGLPVPDRTARNGAMALSLVMLFVGLAVAFSGPEVDLRRRELLALEAERDRLFEESLWLPEGPELQRKLQRLAVIYRKLDES